MGLDDAVLSLARTALEFEEESGVLVSLTAALGHCRSEQAIADLQALSIHRDGAVRFAVPTSLSMCASDRFELVADALLALSADPDDDVRWSAAFELGAWLEVSDDPRISDRLNDLVNDPSVEVRDAVRRAVDEASRHAGENGSGDT